MDGSPSAARGSLVLATLTAAATALAALALATDRASTLEAASFVTGAVCVWLTVRENVWNFPIGLVNVVTFCVVFWRAGLYGDAALQVVYFALGVIGWAMWLRGGEDKTALPLGRASARERWAAALFSVAAAVILWRTLRLVGGSASLGDAVTTSLSLTSQWLLNKKRLENWLGWILADALYVPLYLSKGLVLTAGLYAVFLAMAVLGYLRWREALARGDRGAPAEAAP